MGFICPPLFLCPLWTSRGKMCFSNNFRKTSRITLPPPSVPHSFFLTTVVFRDLARTGSCQRHSPDDLISFSLTQKCSLRSFPLPFHPCHGPISIFFFPPPTLSAQYTPHFLTPFSLLLMNPLGIGFFLFLINVSTLCSTYRGQ